ncbi:hypothetical protein phi9181_ORF033 [Enterococcus phage 9181]|nr:hypothetical protein phi9181_ORF033 [Enterococcus phage 9181]
MENKYYRTLVIHAIKNDYATEWELYLDLDLEGYDSLMVYLMDAVNNAHDDAYEKIVELPDMTGCVKYIDASLITDFTLSANISKEEMEEMVADALGLDEFYDDEEEDLW